MIFLLMDCQDNQKVSCASFMLKDTKLWWLDNREILSPDGSVIAWSRFKEVFLKKYYPKVARLKKNMSLPT